MGMSFPWRFDDMRRDRVTAACDECGHRDMLCAECGACDVCCACDPDSFNDECEADE